jgi:hypothetical protein
MHTNRTPLSQPRNVTPRRARDASQRRRWFAVTTPKIKNGAVTAAKLNVTGVTVPNALHANSANTAASAANATNAGHASTADTAVNATNAGHAPTADTAVNATNANTVGGVTVKQFSVKLAPNAGATTLLETGLVTLTGACTGGVSSVTLAKHAGAPSEAVGFSAAATSSNKVTNGGADFFSEAEIDAGSTAVGSVIHVEVTTTTGKKATINMLARDATNFSPSENVCVFSGTVTFD